MEETHQECNKVEVDVPAVQNSWRQIKESLGEKAPETVGMLVFENLFSDYPDNMNYFKNYGKNKEEIMKNEKFIRHAKERVFGTFDRTINSLDDQKEISNITAWLAKVHGPKGVKTTDFLNLGNAILKSLGLALGDNFTPELKESWNALLVNFMTSIGSIIRN